jgi:hypothetical protein
MSKNFIRRNACVKGNRRRFQGLSKPSDGDVNLTLSEEERERS